MDLNVFKQLIHSIDNLADKLEYAIDNIPTINEKQLYEALALIQIAIEDKKCL
ncbi:MAG: hypothetical protein WA324_27665 [Bryobacteraceae bacterium]